MKGMKRQILLAFLSSSVILAGYLFYTPMPPGTRTPFRTGVLMSMFNILNSVLKVEELLGYGSFAQNIHKWQQRFSIGPEQVSSFDDVEAFTDNIDGVDVIVYRPLPRKEKAPATIYIHGGGWALLQAKDYHSHCYEYAKRSGTVVISVNYRLAPDHPFPGPVEDCLKVTRFLLKNGDRYNIDVHKVGIAGDSAGGNLAAVVTLALSKEQSDLPPLLYQVLFVPVLQAFNMKTSSYVDNDLPVLSNKRMAEFCALYFGLYGQDVDKYAEVILENRHIPPELQQSEYAEYVHNKFLPEPKNTDKKNIGTYHDEVYNKIKDILFNPLFSPLMANDLSSLPSTFICYAEFDVLRDDSLHYARRLKDAGVDVQTQMMKDGTHADFHFDIPQILRIPDFEKVWNTTINFVQDKIMA